MRVDPHVVRPPHLKIIRSKSIAVDQASQLINGSDSPGGFGSLVKGQALDAEELFEEHVHVLGVLADQVVLELLAQDRPHVLDVDQRQQEGGQFVQLRVFLAGVERNDGDAVVQLQRVGVGRVVDEHQVLEAAVLEDGQVLHVEAFRHLSAVLSEQPLRHELAFGVQIVDDRVSIAVVRGGEDNDLEVLRELLEDGAREGADVDACLGERGLPL